ncbi:hypothetical protein [Streptomyces sp. NPDC050982]|uniref:hypothetical protein n=1 Tax=Streptomyces sp. NPDC050982 TaxID=3154746 RepID=UPI0033EE28F4
MDRARDEFGCSAWKVRWSRAGRAATELFQDELAEFNSKMRTAVASRMDSESAPDRSCCLGGVLREVSPLVAL